MRRYVLCLVGLLFLTSSAFAQDTTATGAPARNAATGVWRDVSFVSPASEKDGATFASISLSAESETTDSRQTAPAVVRSERGGFTILVNLGVGFQNDVSFGESATGLGGLNLGVGGFLNNNVALMFRISGTNVSYGGFDQVSGVAGATVQYWVSDRFNVEVGGGLGFWNDGSASQNGYGLILGAGVVVFNRGHHVLQAGAEYAPAFTDWGTIHNIGFTFGYQYHR